MYKQFCQCGISEPEYKEECVWIHTHLGRIWPALLPSLFSFFPQQRVPGTSGNQRYQWLPTAVIVSGAMVIRLTGFLILSIWMCSSLIEPASLCEQGWGGKYIYLWVHICVHFWLCWMLSVAALSQTGEISFFPSSSPPWGVHPLTCFHCHLNGAGFCLHLSVLEISKMYFCAGVEQRQGWKVLVPIFLGVTSYSPPLPPPHSWPGISHKLKNVCKGKQDWW